MVERVQLQFLGCGDAFSSGGRFSTCFRVSAPSCRFLIDCGASSLLALHRHGLTSDDVDSILITHFHGDHYGGLPFLLLDAARQRRRQRPLTVVTPPGGEARTRALMEQLYPGMGTALEALDLRFIEYRAHQSTEVDGLVVTALPVTHSEAACSHGLRIGVDGRVIAFSGDTAWCEALPPLADGADLFICECTFLETGAPNHLDYRTLQRHLGELRARRIILTHLGEEMLANPDRVALTCAEDGMVLDVGCP